MTVERVTAARLELFFSAPCPDRFWDSLSLLSSALGSYFPADYSQPWHKAAHAVGFILRGYLYSTLVHIPSEMPDSRQDTWTTVFFCIIFKTPWSRVLEKLRGSASQGIRRILWNPNVHYYIHKSPPLAPVLGWMNSLHNLPSYVFKIEFNITLSYTQIFQRKFSFRIFDQNPACLSCITQRCNTSCPPHRPW